MTSRYFSGLDLGPAAESTALAVLERTAVAVEPDGDRPRYGYELRYLERFPPGTPYAEVFGRVANVLARPPLAHSTVVVGTRGLSAANRPRPRHARAVGGRRNRLSCVLFVIPTSSAPLRGSRN